MAKQRESKPDEFFKAKIRELEKENRALRRRNKELEQASHIYEAIVTDEIEPIKAKEKEITCDSCGKNKLSLVEILGKWYGSCRVCGPMGRIK